MNLVGRVTPCAPSCDTARPARRGLTRPTTPPGSWHKSALRTSTGSGAQCAKNGFGEISPDPNGERIKARGRFIRGVTAEYLHRHRAAVRFGFPDFVIGCAAKRTVCIRRSRGMLRFDADCE